VVRRTRARASPILHPLFNPARDSFVFTRDFVHCALQSRIIYLQGFDANFLGVESPKIWIVPKRAHQLAPVVTRPPYRPKPSNMRPRVAATTHRPMKKPRRCRAGLHRLAAAKSLSGGDAAYRASRLTGERPPELSGRGLMGLSRTRGPVGVATRGATPTVAAAIAPATSASRSLRRCKLRNCGNKLPPMWTVAANANRSQI
jgi:hypothetical protein